MRKWEWQAMFGLLCIVAAGAGATWHYRHPIRALVWKLMLPESPPAPADGTRFAVIGDYGSGSPYAWHVALMVKSWNPDFVVTVGDNNYPVGATETIDRNVGRFYHEFISPYLGRYGNGAAENRFFPIAGHRDWDTDSLRPYLEYFTLPGNERYYEVARGPVRLFMLDTDAREPDGATAASIQASWLRERLEHSQSPWNLVLAHHAPYTSHAVEDTYRMRWSFGEWGADAVLSGYYHVYERLEVDGLPYFVNGAGGSWLSRFGETDPHSVVRYGDDYGAVIVDATADRLVFRFVNRSGRIIDHVTLTGNGSDDRD